ncbi:NAD-dependent epimerase/dehydratase, partial [mine drainage metagenome]
GRSKWQGEQIVREQCRGAGVPFTILRPGNVIGPGSQFITRMGKELRRGVLMTLDGGQVHAGLLYVDNLVDYLLWAAKSPQALGECFNVRDPGEVTWGQFIQDFKRALNGRGWVIDLPFAVADGLAHLSAGVLGRLLPGEPLLHPLLVRLFGRTCGHSIRKIQTASGFVGAVPYSE